MPQPAICFGRSATVSTRRLWPMRHGSIWSDTAWCTASRSAARRNMGELLRRRVVVLALVASLSSTALAAEGTAPGLQLPRVLSSRTIALPVLLYHRIGQLNGSLPAITRRLTVSPADFAAQMEWLG